MCKANAIVIGKNFSTSLGIIRALGVAGYSVYVVNTNGITKNRSPELNSRYVKASKTVVGVERLGATLNDWSQLNGKMNVIIPTDDATASWLDLHMPEFANFCIPSVRNTLGALTEVMDKGVQKKLANDSGISVARSCSISIDDGDYAVPSEIVYPCFTKPQVSIGSPKTFIRKCEDELELRSLLDEVAAYGSNVILVEQYLEIETEYVVSGVSVGGDVIIPAFMKKIRIGSGDHKGVTAMAEVIDAKKMEQLRHCLTCFMHKVDLCGLFDMEIIESNGIFYFNELNLRPGAANYGITASGVNLPALYMEYVETGKVETIKNDIHDGLIFVSEKVEMEDYQAGYITWKQYKQHIKQADVHFIMNRKDVRPWLLFSAKLAKIRLKKILKRFS